MIPVPQILFFLILIFFLTAILLFTHYLRIRVFRGPFVLFIVFLWMLIYIIGHFNYNFSIVLSNDWQINIRLSSALFTILFAGLLLVYITEGSLPCRRIILVSSGAQLLLASMQLALYYSAEMFLKDTYLIAAKVLFYPSPLHLLAGILTAILDILIAIVLFQFMINRLTRKYPALILILTLLLTMAFDAAFFVGITRYQVFWGQFSSHLLYKSTIVLLLGLPLRAYILWFSSQSNLSLTRGSLDIFGRLRSLEGDLTDAHAELRTYAENLENKVNQRTATIAAQKSILDRELRTARDLQRLILPDPGLIRQTDIHVLYQPMTAVSGDLYNFNQIGPDEFYIFLADISGHGVSAAMIASMCQMSLSRVDFKKGNPASILDNLSAEIQAIESSHHLTAILIFINTREGKLTYASGGHIPQYLMEPTGITELGPTGILLGSSLDGQCHEHQLTFHTGDRLVLFTDCALEYRERSGFYSGSERFRSFLSNHIKDSPAKCLQAFEEELRKTSPEMKFHDDLTVLILDLP